MGAYFLGAGSEVRNTANESRLSACAEGNIGISTDLSCGRAVPGIPRADRNSSPVHRATSVAPGHSAEHACLARRSGAVAAAADRRFDSAGIAAARSQPRRARSKSNGTGPDGGRAHLFSAGCPTPGGEPCSPPQSSAPDPRMQPTLCRRVMPNDRRELVGAGGGKRSSLSKTGTSASGNTRPGLGYSARRRSGHHSLRECTRVLAGA